LSVLIHIHATRDPGGVTAYRVALSGGTTIGVVRRRADESIIASTPEGHRVTHGDTSVQFATVVDAAAHVWMAFMARPIASPPVQRRRGARSVDGASSVLAPASPTGVDGIAWSIGASDRG
jgi:hypothetical protein